MTTESDVLTAALRRVGDALDGASIDRAAVGTPYVRLPEPAVRTRRRVTRPAIAIAVFVAAVSGMGALAWSGDEPARTVPAHAAGDHERILLTAPGWTIVRYDEQPEGRTIHAETTFERADGARLDLHQRSHDYNDEFMTGSPNATVLGEPAVILDTTDQRTFWRQGDWDLELRGGEGLITREELTALLASLRYVDEDAWRASLPASVVLPEARPALVDEILVGVPIPPGFDPARLGEVTSANDRYQATAQTLRPIVCAWTQRWLDADAQGDAATADAALVALQTAPTWPILEEMARQGDWPRVVQSSIAAITEPRAKNDTPRAAAERLRQGIGCA